MSAGDDPTHDLIAHRARFHLRIRWGATYAFLLLAGTLVVGMIGLEIISAVELGARLPLVDAFHEAAMLLAGMGPQEAHPGKTAWQLFTGVYAIFCGVMLLGAAGALFAPFFHRLMRRFHVEDEQNVDGR